MPERRSLQLSNALRDVLPEQLERPLPSSPVLQSHGLTTHIPDAVHTGLRAVCLFETLDSTEEVTAWLHLLDLDRYCSTFIEHGITGRVLLGLNARELRDSLGVMRLKDRRTLIDGIRYLEERLIGGGKSGYPEDGRILTHLSNERLLLLWIRYSIVAQTVAIAILFLLGDIPVGKVSRKIVAASFAFIAGGVCAQLYGGYRYFRMLDMIDTRGRDFTPDYIPMFLPSVIAVMSVIIFLHFNMADDVALPDSVVREAAMLVMLSV